MATWRDVAEAEANDARGYPLASGLRPWHVGHVGRKRDGSIPTEKAWQHSHR